jgi:N-acetylglutamate synthase-like GNAT family acetyltransferase
VATISLRPVRAEDEPFLFEVYTSTRAEEMALVPWPEAQRAAFLRMQFTAQQQHYQQEYPNADHLVIMADETPVGRLYIDRAAHVIMILDVTLLPEQRGRGRGTQLLRDLCAEATEPARPLQIYVETFNRSQTLFARLGFKPVQTEGFHQLWEWRPQAD